MPYAIDFEEIENKLFLLQQLCHSGRSYCHDYRIASKSDDPSEIRGDWFRYSGRLNVLVNNYLIECAIKTRIIQDFLSDKNILDPQKLDNEVTNGSVLGVFKDGSDLTSIRTACNKIVHATEVEPQWEVEEGDDGEEFEFWEGEILLVGEHHDNPWHLHLYVEEWCFIMNSYYSTLHDRVDWFNVW